MKLYCLCHKNGNKNRVLERDENLEAKAVLLERSMFVEKTGATQMIEVGRGRKQHHPDVDIYCCQYCGATIALEG